MATQARSEHQRLLRESAAVNLQIQRNRLRFYVVTAFLHNQATKNPTWSATVALASDAIVEESPGLAGRAIDTLKDLYEEATGYEGI